MAVEQVNIKCKTGTRNRYAVPVKQWRKWSVGARRVFNELYSSMIQNQDLFMHPSQAGLVSKRNWKTTAWNAAWIAASAATPK